MKSFQEVRLVDNILVINQCSEIRNQISRNTRDFTNHGNVGIIFSTLKYSVLKLFPKLQEKLITGRTVNSHMYLDRGTYKWKCLCSLYHFKDNFFNILHKSLTCTKVNSKCSVNGSLLNILMSKGTWRKEALSTSKCFTVVKIRRTHTQILLMDKETFMLIHLDL